jgi:hypothetical protein
MLEELDGVKFLVAVNGQHLKKYFPSMWDDEQYSRCYASFYEPIRSVGPYKRKPTLRVKI